MKRIPRSAPKSSGDAATADGAAVDGAAVDAATADGATADGAAVDGAPYTADTLPPRDAELAVPADAAPGSGAAPVDIAAAVAAAGLGGASGPRPGSSATAPHAPVSGAIAGAAPGSASGSAPGSASGSVSGSTSGSTSGRAASKKRAAAPSRRQQRRFARERAVQALYQWHMTGASSSDVRREFLATQDMGRVDVDYFEAAFRGVTLTPATVDDELAGVLDRELAEVDPIERAILRLATWELRSRPDTPALVVINEGVEIAKRFCAEPGYRYVNGVLDRLATLLRAAEMTRA